MAEAALVRVEFAGEWLDVDASRPFIIGREGDLAIDDNQYLHRQFLELALHDGLWWLTNVGSRIAATVSSGGGGVQSWLSPGARLPIVFAEHVVVFTAGPTTYELGIHATAAPFQVSRMLAGATAGDDTVIPIGLTPMQRALIVALAEPLLRREGVGISELPSNAAGAERLGWTASKFNRKLDNVCDRLTKMGVQGLRGGAGNLATNRRARLVEYAVVSQLVTRGDLPLLDDPEIRNGDE